MHGQAHSTCASWQRLMAFPSSSTLTTARRASCLGLMECWMSRRSTTRWGHLLISRTYQLLSLPSLFHLPCPYLLSRAFLYCLHPASSQAHGEPLFSSHMLDLSEEVRGRARCGECEEHSAMPKRDASSSHAFASRGRALADAVHALSFARSPSRPLVRSPSHPLTVPPSRHSRSRRT